MRVAALISQPMRASHCAAYLNTEDSRHTVLTGDPAAFAAYEFAGGIRVVKVTPPPELLPTAKLARSARGIMGVRVRMSRKAAAQLAKLEAAFGVATH